MVSKAVLFTSADGDEERALLPVANKPFIVHALDELSEAGVRHVAVVAPAGLAPDIHQLVDDVCGTDGPGHVVATDRGFANALADLVGFIGGDPFVVHLGDSLAHGGLADAIDSPRLEQNDALALVEERRNGVVPLNADLANLRAAGIYVLGPGALDLVREGDGVDGLDREIGRLIERLAAAGGRVQIRAVEDRWRWPQRPDTLLRANRFCLSALKAVSADSLAHDADLQGPVVVHPSARLQATTVRGPVIIGQDVCVIDAYIGPYTSIGPGAVIENSEVENSIIFPGASIRHLGGRLEASIVGRQARIFRDFRLPRAVRVNVGDGAEIAIT